MTKVNRQFITMKGLERLKAKIAEMKVHLKELQEEKAHAYTASGDGWHDNPGWLQLGQKEEQLSADIVALESSLHRATVYQPRAEDAGKVRIGARVHYLMRPLGGPGRLIENTIEIAGAGESNIREKLVSYDSPIGAALYDMVLQEEKAVTLPNGIFNVQVKAISYE
jgi:transcription elongation GreA/GreB family factor